MPRYILGADEDFNPFRLVVRYTSGNFNGQDVTTGEGDATPPITPGNPVNGPSYYGGRACTPASVPLAPSPNAIAVVERGDCTFTVKVGSVEARGYQAIVIFNNTIGVPNCDNIIGMLAAGNIPALGLLPRSAGYKALNITGYNPANCPSGSNPALPAVEYRGSPLPVRLVRRLGSAEPDRHLDDEDGQRVRGARVARRALRDGLRRPVDPRDRDRGEPRRRLHRLLRRGARVVDWSTGQLRETGRFIDTRGNNFWGTELWVRPDGRRYMVMSDRDYGVYILRYGTDLGVKGEARTSRKGQVVTWTGGVTNPGTIDSTGTVLRINLPGVRVIAARRSQGRCSKGKTVVCRLGTLAEGRAGAGPHRGPLREEREDDGDGERHVAAGRLRPEEQSVPVDLSHPPGAVGHRRSRNRRRRRADGSRPLGRTMDGAAPSGARAILTLPCDSWWKGPPKRLRSSRSARGRSVGWGSGFDPCPFRDRRGCGGRCLPVRRGAVPGGGSGASRVSGRRQAPLAERRRALGAEHLGASQDDAARAPP